MNHKPCPFCGSETVLVVEGSNFRWKRVECVDCGACGPETRLEDFMAWELWDERVEDKS